MSGEEASGIGDIYRRHGAAWAAKRGQQLIEKNWLDQHGVSIGTMEAEPLYHASLDPEEYRDLLASNGFEVVNHLVMTPTAPGRRSGWRRLETSSELEHAR